MNRTRVVAILMLAAGLILFIVSLLWTAMAPTNLVWTREQGVEQSKASTQLHKLTHEAAHAEVANISKAKKEEARRKLAESKKRFDASRAALDHAQTVRARIPFALRWIGVAAMVIGLGVYLTVKDQSPTRSSSARSRSSTR